jgi:hypothetical protein
VRGRHAVRGRHHRAHDRSARGADHTYSLGIAAARVET